MQGRTDALDPRLGRIWHRGIQASMHMTVRAPSKLNSCCTRIRRRILYSAATAGCHGECRAVRWGRKERKQADRDGESGARLTHFGFEPIRERWWKSTFRTRNGGCALSATPSCCCCCCSLVSAATPTLHSAQRERPKPNRIAAVTGTYQPASFALPCLPILASSVLYPSDHFRPSSVTGIPSHCISPSLAHRRHTCIRLSHTPNITSA